MTPRRPVIGVMGAGEFATEEDCALAEELGERLAAEGWVVLTGGRDCGVMAAASRGAKRVAGSLTIGILPYESSSVSPHVDVAIVTGMGEARNAINVLSSRVVVACGRGGSGTASEVALGQKAGRPVVWIGASDAAREFFASLGATPIFAASVDDAIAHIRGAIA